MRHAISTGCVLLTMLVFAACEKKVLRPKVVTQTKTADTNIIWKQQQGYGMEPRINSMMNVVANGVFGENGSMFFVYNKENGEKLLTWQDYLVPDEIIPTRSTQFINDHLVAISGTRSYCFNSLTGATVWRHNFQGMYADPHLFKDDSNYVYRTIYDKYKYYYYRTPYDKCDWKLIWSEPKNFSYSYITNSHLAISYNTSGEKLLISSMYQLKNVNGSNYAEPRVLAYNMTQRKIEWDKNLSEKYVEFSPISPLVYNGLYYSFAAYGPTWYLVAINVTTGQVAFDIVLPDFGTKMMVYNGKLIVTCNGRSPVLCYNTSNGSLIWSLDLPYPKYEQINFNYDNICLFKNYLLSTQNDYFLGVNLINGRAVCYKKYLDDKYQHDMGLAVNEERRVYYTMNGNYFMAHKLPVEIRY